MSKEMRNQINKVKNFKQFNESFSSPNKKWDDMTTYEKVELLFGKQSNLDKQFSEIMVKHLVEDDTVEWSTYNAVKIELENYDKLLNLEIKYRITDGEYANKVILSVINKVENPSKELLRLKNKVKNF